VLGWLEARRHLLTLSADYLERVTLSHGDLRDLLVSLGYTTPALGPVSLFVGGRYEHWGSYDFADDSFDLGGAEAGLRLSFAHRVEIEARYRFGARYYSDRALKQLDFDHRARGSLELRATSWLSLGASYTYTNVASNEPTAPYQRHFAELRLVATPTSWLSMTAGYGIGPQHVNMPFEPPGNSPATPRDDRLQSFDLSITAWPLVWLEVFARYSYLISTSTDATGQYQRNQVLAGVGARWDFVHRVVPLAPRVSPAGISFRHRAPPGKKVALVGDWNGWQPLPLDETSRGLYAGTYTVPKGRHEYAFTVDGEQVSPPDAAAFVPDGFGGKNGVLEVP
jgi:hypothetical protein